jgi:hypothetical protein
MAAAPDDDARRTLAELEAKLRELERELLRGYEPGQAEADPFAAPEEPAAEPAVFPVEEAEPEPAAPPAFDAAEWTTPVTREDVEPEPSFEAEPESAREPEAADEPEPTYDGGLAREPLPDSEAAPAEEAEAVPPYPVAPQALEPPALAPEPAALAPEPEPEPEPEPVARLDHDALDAAHGMLAALRGTIEDMGLTAARVTAEAQAVADDHGRALGRLARAAQAAARAEEAAHEAGRLAATVVVEAGPFADAGAVTALRDALASQPGARDAYIRGVEGGRAVIEVHLTPPSA